MLNCKEYGAVNKNKALERPDDLNNDDENFNVGSLR